jgi:hypothetical protein
MTTGKPTDQELLDQLNSAKDALAALKAKRAAQANTAPTQRLHTAPQPTVPVSTPLPIPTFGQTPTEPKPKFKIWGSKEKKPKIPKEIAPAKKQEREQRRAEMLRRVQEAKDSGNNEKAREIVLQYVEETREKGITSKVSKGIKLWDDWGKDRKDEQGNEIKASIGAKLTKTAISIAGTGAMTFLGVGGLEKVGINSASKVLEAGATTFLGKRLLMGVGAATMTGTLMKQFQKFQNLDKSKKMLILGLLGTAGVVGGGVFLASGAMALSPLLARGAAGAVGFGVSRLTRKYEGKIKNRTEQSRNSINLDDLEANLENIEKDVAKILKKADRTRVFGKITEMLVAGAVGTMTLEAAGMGHENMTHNPSGSTRNIESQVPTTPKTGATENLGSENGAKEKTDIPQQKSNPEITAKQSETPKKSPMAETEKTEKSTPNTTKKVIPEKSNVTNKTPNPPASKTRIKLGKIDEENLESKLNSEVEQLLKDIKKMEKLLGNEKAPVKTNNTDQEWRTKLDSENKKLIEKLETILKHKLTFNPFEKHEIPKPFKPTTEDLKSELSSDAPHPTTKIPDGGYTEYDLGRGENVNYDKYGNEILVEKVTPTPEYDPEIDMTGNKTFGTFQNRDATEPKGIPPEGEHLYTRDGDFNPQETQHAYNSVASLHQEVENIGKPTVQEITNRIHSLYPEQNPPSILGKINYEHTETLPTESPDTILKSHPEFSVNPFGLNADKLAKVASFHYGHVNTDGWNNLNKIPVNVALEADTTQDTMDPRFKSVYSYVQRLQEITDKKPRRVGFLFTRPERIDEYVRRILQEEIKQQGTLDRIERKFSHTYKTFTAPNPLENKTHTAQLAPDAPEIKDIKPLDLDKTNLSKNVVLPKHTPIVENMPTDNTSIDKILTDTDKKFYNMFNSTERGFSWRDIKKRSISDLTIPTGETGKTFFGQEHPLIKYYTKLHDISGLEPRKSENLGQYINRALKQINKIGKIREVIEEKINNPAETVTPQSRTEPPQFINPKETSIPAPASKTTPAIELDKTNPSTPQDIQTPVQPPVPPTPNPVIRISEADTKILDNNKGLIGSNTLGLEDKQLLFLVRTNNNFLNKIAPETHETMWSFWHDRPLIDFNVTLNANDLPPNDFDKMNIYLQNLQNISGIKPKLNSALLKAESYESYVGRALQAIIKNNQLNTLTDALLKDKIIK